MSTKNILLAGINSNSVKHLSAFALNMSEISRLTAIYDKAKKAVQGAKKRMTAEASHYYTSTTIASDEIELHRHTVYKSNGIANIPVMLYGITAGKDRTTLKTVVDCNSYLDRIEGQYKEACRQANKAYDNAILAIVPQGAYEAYKAGLTAGTYTTKQGNTSFCDYVAKTCKYMGFLGADDAKAVRKFTDTITIYFGANFRRTAGTDGNVKQALKAISERTFNQLYVSAIISRLIDKNVLRLTADGFVRLTAQQAEQAKQEKKTA